MINYIFPFVGNGSFDGRHTDSYVGYNYSRALFRPGDGLLDDPIR